MHYIEQSDIIRSAASAHAAYAALNNAGEGYDPTGDDLVTVSEADTTDGVSIYRWTDDDGDQWLVLVGTDGRGSEDSRWAVRVPECGVRVDADGAYCPQ